VPIPWKNGATLVAKSPRPATGDRKKAATGDRNRTYIIVAVVAVLVVGGILLFSRGGGQAATTPLNLTLDPQELQQARGVSMGNEDAPVQLYEFADFQCPACAQFSTFVHPLIKERLVDTGIVRLVRYDFPLIMSHRHAFLASRAARCAGEQGRYWEYHDFLYGRQPTWSPQRDPTAEFETMADQVGIDRRQFQQCLRSDQHAEEVTRNLRLGESLGVQGTPTLMLNGERIMVRDYRDLEERVFEAAGRTPPATAPDAS
jgi:protein-disulfide isomerase